MVAKGGSTVLVFMTCSEGWRNIVLFLNITFWRTLMNWYSVEGKMGFHTVLHALSK